MVLNSFCIGFQLHKVAYILGTVFVEMLKIEKTCPWPESCAMWFPAMSVVVNSLCERGQGRAVGVCAAPTRSAAPPVPCPAQDGQEQQPKAAQNAARGSWNEEGEGPSAGPHASSGPVKP